jgi:hypothetical protein
VPIRTRAGTGLAQQQCADPGALHRFTFAKEFVMPQAVLTISSKNYGAWSLRGWLLVKFSGLEFSEKILPPDDADMRAEILLLSSSILVPSLKHEGIKVWDTLAIGEYLNEIKPKAGLLPTDIAARAHCRAICSKPGRVPMPTSNVSRRSGSIA